MIILLAFCGWVIATMLFIILFFCGCRPGPDEVRRETAQEIRTHIFNHYRPVGMPDEVSSIRRDWADGIIGYIDEKYLR